MNSTACPWPLATDGAFQRDATPCQADLRAFWAATGACIAMKAAPTAWFSWRRWRRRRDAGASTAHATPGARRKAKAWPLPLVFGWTISVVMTVTIVTIGVGVANCANGISFALYSLTFLVMAMDKVHQLFKMVRLGMRIVPRSLHRTGPAGGGGGGGAGQHRHAVAAASLAKLQEFDVFGRVGLFTQTLSILASCLCLVILSPIFPDMDRLLGVLGWWTKALFMVFYILSMGWHLQRIKTTVRSSQANAASVPERDRDAFQQRTAAVVRFLVQTQVATVGGGMCVLVPFLLLAVEAVEWSWWFVLLLTGGIEITTTFLVTFACARSRKDSTSSTVSRTGGAGGDTGGNNDRNNAQRGGGNGNHSPNANHRRSQSHNPSTATPASLVFMETVAQVKRKMRNYRKRGKKMLSPITSDGAGEDAAEEEEDEDAAGAQVFPQDRALQAMLARDEAMNANSSVVRVSDLEHAYGPGSQAGGVFVSDGVAPDTEGEEGE